MNSTNPSNLELSELNTDPQSDVSAVIALSDLQLAYVGGGSGDIII
ncbi:MAG: hypothetical protein HY255_08705 [Betaproteobacteria bacterium]|nr:hypothetical protein [Betaproteobacteria bacterium]